MFCNSKEAHAKFNSSAWFRLELAGYSNPERSAQPTQCRILAQLLNVPLPTASDFCFTSFPLLTEPTLLPSSCSPAALVLAHFCPFQIQASTNRLDGNLGTRAGSPWTRSPIWAQPFPHPQTMLRQDSTQTWPLTCHSVWHTFWRDPSEDTVKVTFWRTCHTFSSSPYPLLPFPKWVDHFAKSTSIPAAETNGKTWSQDRHCLLQMSFLHQSLKDPPPVGTH